MARRPLVTGEGAKYVAAGKKQQAANSGRSMVAAHSKGMASMYQQSQGNPSSGDHAPAPPSSTPQHLSGQQFAATQVSSMHPGGAGMARSFTPTTKYNETRTMNPGGARSKRTPVSGYIPGGGNTKASGRFGASSTATPAASSPAPATSHWDEGAFPGVLPASAPRPRGNANTSVTNALGGKSRRSRSVKRASVGGSAGGGQGGGKMRLAKLLPHPSRHAGKLSQHLRSVTGSA